MPIRGDALGDDLRNGAEIRNPEFGEAFLGLGDSLGAKKDISISISNFIGISLPYWASL